MGQDTSGSSLTTNAAATGRSPCCRFRVDWADAGFGSETSWTDESAYVESVRGDMTGADWRRSLATVGSGVAGVCYVTCHNPVVSTGGYSGFRFSPSNSNGPLYDYMTYTASEIAITEGAINMKRAQVQMGFSTEYLTQITGYIVGVTENYTGERATVTFEIRDRAADAVLTRASTTLKEYVTAKSYLQTLAALFDRDAVASADQIFDDGLVTVEYMWLDDETVWDEMNLVVEAQMGRLWFDKDGDLHFDDGAHFVKANSNSWDDPTTSQATLTTSAFQNIGPRYDLGSIYNHVIVEYQPRYVAALQVIYSRPDVVVVRPNSSLTVDATYRYPVSSIATPTATTDYNAVTAGGTDITSSCTVTASTEYAGGATLALANGSTDYAAYFTKLQLRGYPLLTEEPSKYETEDTTSITEFGRRTWAIRSNPYIQSYRHAEMIGDFLLARFKDPVQILTLRGIPARPWLEVGDRITVTETNTAIDTDYYIARIGWSWRANALYAMDMDLMRCSDLYRWSDWFTIGTSYYGAGTGRGRLFY